MEVEAHVSNNFNSDMISTVKRARAFIGGVG
jgi:hypothetical protein